MLKLLKERVFFLLSCVFFRLVLDVSYFIFVNPVFSYTGFVYDFSIINYSWSLVVYFVALAITPHLLVKVSDYFIASFLLTVIAPLSSLFGLSGSGFFPLLVTMFVFVFFGFFRCGNIASSFLPVPNIKKVLQGRLMLLIVALVSVVILIIWYFYSGAFRYFNLNFFKVYEYREASAELANIGFFGYFSVWVYKVFSIFLMCYFLLRKNYLYFFVFFAIQVLFFGVSAHKSVLFTPLMVLGIWFYFRRTKSMAVMPLCLSFIVVVCLLLFIVFDHVMTGSLLIRRVFFVPAKLTVDYFSFFYANDFVWWSNSILKDFNIYPYEYSMPEMIGQYNGSETNANNGFIASGYGHAGLFGVAIYSLIFVYFLKVLDTVILDSDVPVWLGLCMTIVPLRSALISSDLLTTLLTHGLALSLIMVLLFRRSKSRHI